MQTKATILLCLVAVVLGCSPTIKNYDHDDNPLIYAIQPVDREPSPLEINKPGTLIIKIKGRVKTMEEKFYSAKLTRGKLKKIPLHVGSILYQDKRVSFNEQGHITRHEHFDGKIPHSKAQYSYDSSGRLTQETAIYYFDTSLVYRQNYIYNLKGQLTKEISSRGSMHQSINQFSYDSIQGIIFSRGFSDNRLLSKVAYTHDSHSNLLSKKNYEPPDADSVLHEIQYRYDSMGNVLKEITEFGEISYIYNKSGLPVQCQEHTRNGLLIGLENYTYTLDEQGNWTQKIIFVLNRPFVIAERKIEYYP